MKKNILWFFVVLVTGVFIGTIILDSFQNYKLHKSLLKADEYSVQNIQNSFIELNEGLAVSQFELIFHNNPFDFDSTSLMKITLNDTLVFEGMYSNEVKIFVPNSLLGKGVRPFLFIQKDGLVFDGWKKEPICFVLKKDEAAHINRLNVVFFPDRTSPSNYIMFPGWVLQ
jgi:hypothetical protein